MWEDVLWHPEETAQLRAALFGTLLLERVNNKRCPVTPWVKQLHTDVRKLYEIRERIHIYDQIFADHGYECLLIDCVRDMLTKDLDDIRQYREVETEERARPEDGTIRCNEWISSNEQCTYIGTAVQIANHKKKQNMHGNTQ